MEIASQFPLVVLVDWGKNRSTFGCFEVQQQQNEYKKFCRLQTKYEIHEEVNEFWLSESGSAALFAGFNARFQLFGIESTNSDDP